MFIKNKFKTGRGRVNYMIKKSKMDLLWKMFKRGSYEKDKSFNKFRGKTKYWLRDYSIYKVIGEKQKTQNWEAWPPKFKDRRIEGIKRFAASNKKRICFYEWLQWQLYEQFRIVSRYAKANKVLLMGDLPFLVSKKSADVWMFRQYFKLDFASGAPPDYFFALGQRWGMPPYDWDKIRENNYDYLAQKLKYSENFYDMYRIDHAIGLFRIWSIPVGEPLQNAGRNGSFDPRDEKYWETHGREILSVMINSTGMLPCAEDLGTVPECSNRVLKSLGIPGMDVQRWMVNPKKEYFFKKPSQYRTNSIAVLSTHDTSAFLGWWKYDFKNPNERGSYVEHIGLLPAIKKHAYIDANVVLRYALETINKARSIFSIQLISDILSIAGYFKNPAESRINIPGTCSNENWSLVMPLSLEEMLCLDINGYLRKTNRDAGRI
jgi:4-alpha-glucanotransferase